MKISRYRRALLAAFLLLLVLPMACKKDKEVVLKMYVAAFLENLEVPPPNTSIDYDINDLLVGGASVTVLLAANTYGAEVAMSDEVPYSFTLDKVVYRGNFTRSSIAYTGTIAKALFTNTSNDSATPNQLKVSVTNSTPTLYLNGVRLPAPTAVPATGGTGGTGGGSNTCPLGTWQTPTCNGAAGKYLVYNFGPGGAGYSDNPDCNGICDNIKYNFRYTVSGNTISYTFTSVDPVTCSGTSRQPPMPSPAGPYAITYTCGNNGNQLVTEAVNTATGVRTVLTFARR